jgi:hypothetical protein
MKLQAQNVAFSLYSAMKEGSKDFVGLPPDELRPLVEDTIADARILGKAAGKAFDQHCVDKGRGECLGLRAEVVQAIFPMQRDMSGWRPYI